MCRKTKSALRIEPKPIIEFDQSEFLPVPKDLKLVTDLREVLDIGRRSRWHHAAKFVYVLIAPTE